MLILTRKINEIVKIGNAIEVIITKVDGNKIRLGITAPANMPVYRKELTAHRPFTKTIPLCHRNGDEPLKGTNR